MLAFRTHSVHGPRATKEDATGCPAHPEEQDEQQFADCDEEGDADEDHEDDHGEGDQEHSDGLPYVSGAARVRDVSEFRRASSHPTVATSKACPDRVRA